MHVPIQSAAAIEGIDIDLLRKYEEGRRDSGLTARLHLRDKWEAGPDEDGVLETEEDYDEATKVIVAKYYLDNIVGREIYPGWTVEFMESEPISMVEEDLMTMFVPNNDGEHIFLPILNFSGKPLRGDLMTHNEDTLGIYFRDELKITKYTDMISGFEIPNPIRELLNDLSDESLEKYFDFIIEQVQDEIEEWDEDIRHYHEKIKPEREG